MLQLSIPLSLGQKNVLMIAVDDLRLAGAAFGAPEILMPNLDALAKRSVVFREAFVQAATCGVSRSSLLTSRRPDTTKVVGNGACPFTTDPAHNGWNSLPQYFKTQGYETAGFGKIFHPNICDGAIAGEQAAAWTVPYYHAPCISLGSIYNGSCYESYPGGDPHLPEGPGGKVTSVYSNSTPASGDTMPDGYIAEHAIALLKTLAARQVNDAAGTTTTAKPFFMAVGFHKPHLPHIAPQEYFDLYPLEKVSLPDNQSRYGPQDAPDIAWNGNGEFLSYTDTKDYNKKHKIAAQEPWMNDTFVRMQRRAYMASASYTDANIGSLLKALEATGVADNTIIALWGDHGWHIGENNEWAKHTAMTWANRAPLLFAVPGLTSIGAVSEDFAEFVDIMPTLTDFAGLPVPPRCKSVLDSQTSELCTEGASLKPVVRRLVAKTAALLETRKSTGFEPLLVSEGGKVAAFGQWPKGGKMGYIVHTRGAANELLRYTEWVTYNASKKGPVNSPIWDCDKTVKCAELYNRTADPNENYNIAQQPGMSAVVTKLADMLHAGWRAL